MKTPEQMEFDFDNLVELGGLDDTSDENFAEIAYKLAAEQKRKQEQLNTEGEAE